MYRKKIDNPTWVSCKNYVFTHNTFHETKNTRLMEAQRGGLEKIHIEKCHAWKVSELESVSQHWKVSALESVNIGKCQHWKVSGMKNVKIRRCQDGKLSDLESVRIHVFPTFQRSHRQYNLHIPINLMNNECVCVLPGKWNCKLLDKKIQDLIYSAPSTRAKNLLFVWLNIATFFLQFPSQTKNENLEIVKYVAETIIIRLKGLRWLTTIKSLYDREKPFINVLCSHKKDLFIRYGSQLF